MTKRDYLRIGSHKDLEGGDRHLYRFFEMAPGILSWGTLIGIVLLSWLWPIGAAVFVLLFSLSWVIRAFYLMAHLRSNWLQLRHFEKVDWKRRMKNLKWHSIYQLVVLPTYNEPDEVIMDALESLMHTQWPRERFIVLLAMEERAGEEARARAERIKTRFAHEFGSFLVTFHPKDLPGEMPGKGSNASYALKKATEKIIDAKGISYEDVIVSSFDIDTQVYPGYFYCVSYHFLTAEKPYRSSFQPVPLYNNNIWSAPFLSRVVATSNTFWQMMEQERPERLVTFSSHSMSLKMLVEVGYWQTNIVSEDSRIFWNGFLYYDGDYRVVPLLYPVSMDANVGKSFWQTAKQVYRQQRRWMWGAENIPYLLYGCIKNKKIPWQKKAYAIFIQVEGFWSLATNPPLLLFAGWLPIFLGGELFNTTLLSYNLPRLLQFLMSSALLGLILLVIVSFSFLPPRPKGKSVFAFLGQIVQWIFVPITILLFGSVPGLETQTRLIFNKPLGFWVTPKYRKKITEQ
ncbi:MAG: glycosyltransferase family 2 protein [Candidatus Niyogibacteria bacterium]|nr:glycosyltransferase family 2 protein [Candidatus Niyogibacteria bacterium]